MSGDRGEAFPRPVARVTSKVPLWDWYEVAEWLFARGKIAREIVIAAKIVREANLFIESQEAVPDNFTKRLEQLAA